MKAERRHELAENELAKVIKNAPSFWQQSGGKFLLALIVALLVIVLVRYRISSNRHAIVQATELLGQARTTIEELQQLGMMSHFGPPQETAVRRRQYFTDANTAISEAMQTSDDRRILAESLVARGDLNWTAASIPPLAGAATQPALQFKDPKELTSTAAEAYQTVLNSYPEVTHAAIASRFSLAAIAEQRGEWDAAKQQYEQIAKETNEIGAYQKLAADRLRMLPTLRQPVVIGKATTEPALSSTVTPLGGMAPTTFVAAPQPATTQAAAAPATAPATTGPTTRP
jgi:hypothetical protein